MHGSDRVNLEARSMVYSPIPEYAPLPLRVQMTNCKQKWYTDWSSQTTFLKKKSKPTIDSWWAPGWHKQKGLLRRKPTPCEPYCRITRFL